MPKGKLSKALLDTLDDAASKTEVEALFKTLLDTLKEFRQVIEQKTALNKDEMASALKDARAEVDTALQQVRALISSNREETRSDNRTTLRLIEQAVNDLRFEIPEAYEDASLREEFAQRLREIEAKIPTLPKEKNVEGMIVEAITPLKEEIKRLREELARRPLGGGGGTSTMGVQYAIGRLAKSETPNGDIDGINTTYTTTQTIHAVLSFAINGQFITDDEYIVSGKTITMDSAIDASLSGTSFRITYI